MTAGGWPRPPSAERSPGRDDDMLVDLLASGADPSADDPLARLLATARDDVAGPVRGPFGSSLDATAPAAPGHRRPRRLAIAAAALLLVPLTTITVAARDAEPDSPLWPVARALYTQHTNARLAEHELLQARTEVSSGRYDQALPHLERALALIAQLRSAEQAATLRSEADAIRRSIPAHGPSPTPAPAESPAHPSIRPPTGPAPSAGAAQSPAAPPGSRPGGGRPDGPGQHRPAPHRVPGYGAAGEAHGRPPNSSPRSRS